MIVKRQPIREVIKEHLVDQIVRGVLPAGAPLSLVDLAAQLGVSVTPLREALIELEAQGFVESALARGFFVRPLDPDEVREIYPIVGALEALALTLGPPRKERLPKIIEINERLASETSPAKRIALDARFHESLLADCENASLLTMLKPLKRRVYRYGYVFLSSESVGESSVAEHRAVTDRLLADDLPGAAEALRNNWRSGPERYLPLLEQLKESASQ